MSSLGGLFHRAFIQRTLSVTSLQPLGEALQEWAYAFRSRVKPLTLRSSIFLFNACAGVTTGLLSSTETSSIGVLQKTSSLAVMLHESGALSLWEAAEEKFLGQLVRLHEY